MKVIPFIFNHFKNLWLFKKICLLFLLLCLVLPGFAENVLFEINFSKEKDGSGHNWLTQNGFKKQVGSDGIDMIIKDGKFVVTSKKPGLKVYTKELNLKNAGRVRIEWGVTKPLKGSNYEKGIYREPLGVTLSFGDQKIDSGSFIVTDVPYFITFLLNKSETPGKFFTGNYYKKGGRYICTPCSNSLNTTIVTEAPLKNLFKRAFNKEMPFVSGLGIESDTRDTDGKSSVYIKKIQILE